MDYYKNFNFKEAEKLIRLALKEDVRTGDITSELLIPKNSVSKAELLVKEDGIIAGLKIFKMVFDIIDKKIKIKFKKKDGDKVKKGEVAAYLTGNTRNLLLGERVSLNILQRMSGVATYTYKMVSKLNNKGTKVIDTRKTTPNMRLFEKAAVLMGGGANHRTGLYDMILIKDNHIQANGGIDGTLEILLNKKRNKNIKTEIEVKDPDELLKVVSKGKRIIDRVMLDNFRIEHIRPAVDLAGKFFEIEISGGVNENNIAKYGRIKGIDYISVGALTHSVDSLDISLNFIT